MPSIRKQLSEIQAKVDLLKGAIAALQNGDGGFKGYYCQDDDSGLYTTGEIVHILREAIEGPGPEWLEPATKYILSHQNPDGGWPFRPGGKSITDVTAWNCLSLHHFGHVEAVQRGIEFIMRSRINEKGASQPGWGLTTYEPDRIYSTWIATMALMHLAPDERGFLPPAVAAEIPALKEDIRAWILSLRQEDGGWRGSGASTHSRTNTALAVLTLFDLGEDARNYASSWRYLKSGLKNGHWNPERELVITREGYELTQEWFTTAFCFRALVRFAKAGVAELQEIDAIFGHLSELVLPNGRVTRLPGTSPDFVWTIPLMLEVLSQYSALVRSQSAAFERFWEQKARHLVAQRKRAQHDVLRHHFPFPVSRVFFSYQHELDHHRRFHLLVDFYEVAIKYAAIVAFAGYMAAREDDEAIRALVLERFSRPSLGDWTALLLQLLRKSKGASKLVHPEDTNTILGSGRPYLDPEGPSASLQQMSDGVVKLRNMYIGHGAVLSQFEYKAMLEEEEPQLYTFVERLRFLATNNSFLILSVDYDEFGESDRYMVRIFKGVDIDDNQCEFPTRLSKGHEESGIRYIYFQNTANNTIVNLYPFLSYMTCPECKSERFFFFNGTKSGESVLYLSYECGHTVEGRNLEHFRKRLSAMGITW